MQVSRSIGMPEELARDVKQCALEMDVSMNRFMTLAIAEAVKRYKKEKKKAKATEKQEQQ